MNNLCTTRSLINLVSMYTQVVRRWDAHRFHFFVLRGFTKRKVILLMMSVRGVNHFWKRSLNDFMQLYWMSSFMKLKSCGGAKTSWYFLKNYLMIRTDAFQVGFLSSLTIFNKGSSLTIVNKGSLLTIVNETTIFIKTIVLKTTIFKRRTF